MSHERYLAAALAQARLGLEEGGIPIGAVLVSREGAILAEGRNRRVQDDSVIHHAEMNCLENAGRLAAAVYQKCTLYSTLSPCPMCSGAALLYKIPRIVIGENVTFQGPEDYVRSQGVKLEILQDSECIQLMRDFIAANPERSLVERSGAVNKDPHPLAAGTVKAVIQFVRDQMPRQIPPVLRDREPQAPEHDDRRTADPAHRRGRWPVR